ncbi:MAG: GTPase HflX [Bacteroidetes bacterium]|nr:GTPase HflX [Bacteroidota bacterium]
MVDKVVLVGIIKQKEREEIIKENLEELAFLAFTAGAKVMGRFTQRRDKPNSRTFVGPGKLEEIKEFVIENEVSLVVFDDELGPNQIRNIEKELECRIIDRTNLILDIFAKRAQTAQSKAQVELAQYEYLLPRLIGMWTHLERQKGGIGLRGPGETEIETDRRIIRSKISLLKKKLIAIDKQNKVQRKNRAQKVRVSLVGYTNAGKSTIMNMLSKSNVFAEDKLFATLDTTVRNVVINQITFLLSDTVGFIRKLPHRLVESFKSTLDEAREADILIHVVDLSHPDFEQHMQTVNETLAELKADHKPTLVVFNKIDKLSAAFLDELEIENENGILNSKLLEETYLATEHEHSIFISAIHKTNVKEFRKTIVELVIETYKNVYPHFPLSISGHYPSQN